jgi:hypothetical protein
MMDEKLRCCEKKQDILTHLYVTLSDNVMNDKGKDKH